MAAIMYCIVFYIHHVKGLDYADESLMLGLTGDQPPPAPSLTKNQKKHARKRQRKKEKEPELEFEIEEIIEGLDSVHTRDSPSATPTELITPTGQDTTTPNVAKQLKALRKKLKQIDELEEKRKSGAKLDPDQVKKIKRRQEIEEEIETLSNS